MLAACLFRGMFAVQYPLLGQGLTSFRYIRIRDSIFPPKPSTWTPHRLLYLFVLTLAYVLLWATTHLVNSPDLRTVFLAARGLAIAPLILPYVVPASWGATHTRPHQTYRVYTLLFKMTSALSFALHAKATFDGLAHSAPDTYYHRHSLHLPFDVETRSAWERTTSAFGRILAATADHPVVGGAGFDVLFSAASLGLWAAVRATSVQDILACAVLGTFCSGVEDSESGHDDHSPGRPSAAAAAVSGRDDSSGASLTRRKRGRRAKGKQDFESAGSEASYEPSPSEAASVAEGDVLPEAGDFDWESTALVWGLTALGGLGAGSAGVLGGECVAR